MATFIFLCNEIEEPDIREYIEEAKQDFSEGDFYETPWSCGNTRKIQVGDRAFLQRTGSYPHGFFAAGYVVEAPPEEQLRLKKSEYANLSSAYFDRFYGNSFMVVLRLEAVVDFDYPLQQSSLKRLPQFQGAQFHFQQGGCEFSPACAPYLEAEWEKHSMELTRKGHGQRLVDVFFELGQKSREQKRYEDAIRDYEKALLIQPNYAKALNVRSICEKLLLKHPKNSEQSQSDTPPAIGSDPAIEVIEDLDQDDNPKVVSDDASTEEAISSGGGFGKSENNKEIENRAIDFITQKYIQNGWTTRSVEKEKIGYDLVCTKNGVEEHVEVKGVSGQGLSFVITAGEVKQAKENSKFVLWLVTSALQRPTAQRWTGREMLEEFSLSPISYMARLKGCPN